MSFLPGSAPLVGRDEELATLAGLAGVDDPPRPGLVLLSGDAGIGKSRLLDALTERAGGAGWRVAVGHCLDLAGSPLPYLPFTEIADRLRTARPERMAQLAARWPDVRPLLGRPAGAEAPLDPPDRGAFFAAVHAALTELGRETPLLLVVEDLHWADQSSYDLLSFLFARRFSVPVSLVASYRRDDLHRRHPLRPIVAAWSRLPGMGRLVLEPLPDADVRRLVEVLEPGALDAAQVQDVVDRAEGNAFFTEELVAAAGSAANPRDLADLLLLRLERLGPDARLVVQSAAAGGWLVPDELLTAVVGLDAGQTGAALREAVEFNVLVAEEQGYRFRHSMLAEAVYADLLPGERRRVHAAYVAALVANPADGTAADLARHALAAGDDPTAYRASRQAGDEAAAVGGPDEAARHYQRALDLVAGDPLAGTVPTAEVVALAEQAASAAAAAGLLRRAETIVSTQLRRLPADAAPVDRARLLVALAEASALTDSPVDERALIQEALALIPAEPPTTLRARAVALYALALAGYRYDEEAVRWAEEGLVMPPELRVGEVTVQLHTVLARVAERGGDASPSEQLLREFAAEAHAARDPAEVRALHQLGSLQYEQGELDQAYDTYRQAAERSAELGRPFAPYGVDARISAAVVAYQRGRWEVAMELTEVGPDVPALAAAGLLAARLAIHAGRGEVAHISLMARIRQQWPTDGVIAVNSGPVAIDLYGQVGDLDAAVAVHDEVVTTLRQLWGADDSQARIRLTAVLLGQLADHLPALDPERGRAHLAHGLEQAERAYGATGMGRRAEPGLESQAWLARLAAEALRLRELSGERVPADQLVAAWRKSVEAFARYGHVYEEARSAARLAAVLRASGATAEAGRVAAAARETASRLGARPLVAELTPLVPGLGGSNDLLTPREREVLGLVAEGLSNRQVGERLFVSTKTASVHVSNILAKLGAHSRTEAATLARRRGLLG